MLRDAGRALERGLGLVSNRVQCRTYYLWRVRAWPDARLGSTGRGVIVFHHILLIRPTAPFDSRIVPTRKLNLRFSTFGILEPLSCAT